MTEKICAAGVEGRTYSVVGRQLSFGREGQEFKSQSFVLKYNDWIGINVYILLMSINQIKANLVV